LEGVISNRDGIGARITIYGDFGMQIREIRSGESYGIQNSLNAHFGLGSANFIDSAFVQWPSGIIDQFLTTSANQFIYLVEGAHPVGINENYPKGISMSVYPNPSSDFITVEFDEMLLNEGRIDYQLIDMLGRVSLSGENIVSNDKIGVSNVLNGFYILNILIEGQVISSQKVKIE
jgi:hypothetical protein